MSKLSGKSLEAKVASILRDMGLYRQGSAFTRLVHVVCYSLEYADDDFKYDCDRIWEEVASAFPECKTVNSVRNSISKLLAEKSEHLGMVSPYPGIDFRVAFVIYEVANRIYNDGDYVNSRYFESLITAKPSGATVATYAQFAAYVQNGERYIAMLQRYC